VGQKQRLHLLVLIGEGRVGYQIADFKSNYGGVAQRWLLVYSEQAYQREKATLDEEADPTRRTTRQGLMASQQSSLWLRSRRRKIALGDPKKVSFVPHRQHA
jgi:hypothetical protein